MSIKNRITAMRGKETRRAFAKRIEIAENTLRNYEEGLSLPNSDVIASMCRATGASAAWLIFGTGPMRSGEVVSVDSDSAPSPHFTSEAPMTARENASSVCAELKRELEMERRERRELAVEIRQLTAEIRQATEGVRQTTVQNHELTSEVRQLWKENGDLREKCARLEERQYQRTSHVDSETMGHAE